MDEGDELNVDSIFLCNGSARVLESKPAFASADDKLPTLDESRTGDTNADPAFDFPTTVDETLCFAEVVAAAGPL